MADDRQCFGVIVLQAQDAGPVGITGMKYIKEKKNLKNSTSRL